jgi:hypothetical protein
MVQKGLRLGLYSWVRPFSDRGNVLLRALHSWLVAALNRSSISPCAACGDKHFSVSFIREKLTFIYTLFILNRAVVKQHYGG